MSNDAGVNNDARPSMEHILGHYTAMRTEMIGALTVALGEKQWGGSPNSPGPGRSAAGEGDPEAEAVGLVTQSFQGTYPPGEWRRAADIVTAVGLRHGFTETGTIVDRPGDIEVYGDDVYGGRYVFGMAVNTILGVSTGGHRWDKRPPDEPTTDDDGSSA